MSGVGDSDGTEGSTSVRVLSVVIPVYNEERTVDPLLRRVLEWTAGLAATLDRYHRARLWQIMGYEDECMRSWRLFLREWMAGQEGRWSGGVSGGVGP